MASNVNWTTGNIETYFVDGDDVIFDNGATIKSVTVDAAGVTVGTMAVNDDYDFTGGTITATGAVTFAAGKMFGLDITDNAPMLSAASMTFSNDNTLNITGYPPGSTTNYTQGFDQATVITTGDLVGFDAVDVTVARQTTADFLSASAYQFANDVKGETRLSWYSTDPNREAHGDFTINGTNSFTLGDALGDNSDSRNKRNDWDGNSLT